jgi:hypothetical protein
LDGAHGRLAGWTCLTASSQAHGPVIAIDKQGDLHLAGRWNHGVREGRWYTFWDDGLPMIETWYRDGKLDGPARLWSDADPPSLNMESQWSGGLRDGSSARWDDEGRPIEINFYAKGRRVGLWRRYDKDGRETGSRSYNSDGMLLAVDGRRVPPPPPTLELPTGHVTWDDCVHPGKSGESKQCLNVFEAVQECLGDRGCADRATATMEASTVY